MTFAMSYWFVSARKWFKGPRINVEHVEGQDPMLDSPATGSEDGGGELKKA